MSDIIEALKSAPDYIGGSGRTEDEIRKAEELIGVEFASDYRCYLKEIGLACLDGHELTGICKSIRLNVVDVTLSKRQHVSEAYAWYVVEETGIDGIVIWQAPDGSVYETIPNSKHKKIANSLLEYITK